MTNQTIIAQIVGMHFRPPAKQVLAVLPAGASLRLEREPDNPYDAKALMVMVDVGQVPQELRGELAEQILGAGFDLEDLLDDARQGALLHLGYVADSDGKMCKKFVEPGNRELAQLCQERQDHVADGIAPTWDAWEGKLGFNPEGKPTVSVDGLSAG